MKCQGVKYPKHEIPKAKRMEAVSLILFLLTAVYPEWRPQRTELGTCTLRVLVKKDGRFWPFDSKGFGFLGVASPGALPPFVASARPLVYEQE